MRFNLCNDRIRHGKDMAWLAHNCVITCRYECAVLEFKSALRNMVTPDKDPEEDHRLKGDVDSPATSPKQINGIDSSKLSILSKTTPPPESSPDPLLANFLVEQVLR